MEAIASLPWWAPWVGSFMAGVVVLALFLRLLRGVAANPRSVSVLLGAQAVSIGVLVLAYLGLDRLAPSGIESRALLWGVALYAILLVGGVGIAWKQRRWIALTMQIAVPCALAALVVAGATSV